VLLRGIARPRPAANGGAKHLRGRSVAVTRSAATSPWRKRTCPTVTSAKGDGSGVGRPTPRGASQPRHQ
jgi:hypothetical protein